MYFFSEVLNIRPAINQIVITDTIKPTAKLTLKTISPKVILQLEKSIMTLFFEGY